MLLWGTNGRSVELDAVSFEAPSDALRARLRRLGLVDPPAPLAAVPVRSALPLRAPDALWGPVPLLPGPGGLPWRPILEDGPGLRLWDALGAPTVGEAVRRAGLSPDQALPVLSRLCSREVQALQLHVAPPSRADPTRLRVWSPPRPPYDRGEVDLTRWHAELDADAGHFDDVETTLAWALGRPHPALQGRTYGQALGEQFGGRGWLGRGVVELGSGSGEVARDLGVRPYVRVDLAPGLLRLSRATAPDTEEVVADARALPFPAGSLPFVFSNEVLADLPWTVDAPRPYGLPPRPGITNTGAFEVVRELARVLAPGGVAWLSEFASDEPEEAAQLDHPEVSVHFGELAEVARAFGLGAERLPLAEFLGLDLHARWLWRPHWEGVRAMARARGLRVEARACPELPFPVEGLRYVPLSDVGPGPLVTRMECVVLRKPPPLGTGGCRPP